ncbi:MAG: trypsin-like peptidase domain-containing protein [Lyngbya sp.]|nr:trypsin-like peptidase domain-containing protein [Lyngbya sp.]
MRNQNLLKILSQSLSSTVLTFTLVLSFPVWSQEPQEGFSNRPHPPQQLALTPTDINKIASEITVRIEGPKGGSGVIIEKQQNTYYILTNWHVVSQVGDYEIVTPDGQRHQVYYSLIRQLPGLDLAVVPFQTSQRYPLAKLANTNNINEGNVVYVAGWPRSASTLGHRLFLSTKGTVEYRQEPRQGYTLVYNNLVRSGMSGGPVLNEAGEVIGINGIVQLGVNPDQIVSAGIEINRFVAWRQATTLPTIPERLMAQPPSPPPQTTPNLPPSPPVNTSISNSNQTYALATSLEEKSGEILSVEIVPPYAISGNSNGTISVWNLATGGLRKTWQGHNSSINGIAVSPNGQILATASDDGSIKLWDLTTAINTDTLPLLHSLTEHSNAVLSVEFTPDGRKLASGSWDNMIMIWDIQTGELLNTLVGHQQLVSTIAISPDGKILASGSKDNTIKIWNLETGELIHSLKGHSLPVLSLAISPDGKILASGSADGTIALWELQTAQPIRRMSGHSDGVWSVVISPDNRTLVSGSWDRTVKLWDVETGQLKGNLTGHSSYVNTVDISPDGQTIVSGGWDGQVKIWKKP